MIFDIEIKDNKNIDLSTIHTIFGNNVTKHTIINKLCTRASQSIVK